MHRFTRSSLLRMAQVTAALMLTLSAGCGGGDSSLATPIDPTVGQIRSYNNLLFKLTTDKATYKLGELIVTTFTVRNVSQQTIELTIGTFPQNHTEILDANGSDLSRQYYFFAGGPLTLKPLESKTFTDTWSVGNAAYELVATPGVYRFRGYLQVNAVNGVLVPLSTPDTYSSTSVPVTVTN